MEEALIKRTMPNSLESEQSVVGSMIMDRDAILTASEILTKDDFYHQQYGVLFEAIVELYNSGQPVDLVTLQNKLREKDVPPEVASLEYISDLVAAVPVTVNVASYAQIVKDKALLRQIIKVNQEIENDCYNGKESVTEILEKTEHDIFALVQNHGNSEYVPIRQVVMNAQDRAGIQAEGNGYRYPDRIYRSGLSDRRIAAVRSDLDRGASFYG
jgi:replicative DNA helicase